MLFLLLSLTFLPESPANAKNFNHYNNWLKKDLFIKLSGYFDTPFLKEIMLNARINNIEYEELNKIMQLLRIKDFSFPEEYFNERRLKVRISIAKKLKQKYHDVLSEIEKVYQVPTNILLSIWGTESDFGKAKLKFLTLKALTFQVYKGEREKYFFTELLEFLKVIKDGKLPYKNLFSSHLGAMGQPQFMPSSYNKLGIDFDLDGKVDIWNNVKDTLASIANFLKSNGWESDLDWGYEISNSSNFPCYMEGPDNIKAISFWEKSGVNIIYNDRFKNLPPQTLTSLFYPKGEYGPKFLVTKNFYVLKKYNNSDLYALYVGHLSDKISKKNNSSEFSWKQTDPISREKVLGIQQQLISNGFDVGNFDGLIGYKTRRSIGLLQEKNNAMITCFPNK